MAQCSYCSITVLFGAVEADGKVFCSERCRDSDRLLERARRVSFRQVVRKMNELHRCPCPKCRGPGPCDVHHSYKVWSFLLASKWVDLPQLSCRRCARKSQWEGLFASLLLGWWGVPWGVIITPLQVWRNVRALWGGPDLKRPSDELEKLVRVGLAGRQQAERANAPEPPSPPITGSPA